MKNNNLKVLFYLLSIPPNYGGGFLRVFRMAARFKSYGCFYKIATHSPKVSYSKDLFGIEKEKDIIFLRNRFLYSFILFPLFLIKNRNEFSVFYVASTQWFTVIPIIVSKLLSKKVIVGVTLSMSDSPAVQPKEIVKGLYYKFKNCQFRFADYIFVNSKLVLEECKSCGYREEVVKLINNPVDTNVFHPVNEEEKKYLRATNDLPKDAFTVLFVGSINKRKGCDIMPAIFREFFCEYDKPISFVMCGQKGYPESQPIINELKDIFSKHHSQFVVKEEVEFTAPYYQMADLFLFPTTNEGMPNVILEAMASGCMILCNRLEGITDYVLPDECLVDNNDSKIYAKLLNRYSKQDINYSEIIRQNRKVIMDHFSILSVDHLIRKYIKRH